MTDEDLETQKNQNKEFITNLVKNNTYYREVIKSLNALISGLPPGVNPDTGEEEGGREPSPDIDENDIDEDTRKMEDEIRDADDHLAERTRERDEDRNREIRDIEHDFERLNSYLEKISTEITNIASLSNEELEEVQTSINSVKMTYNFIESDMRNESIRSPKEYINTVQNLERFKKSLHRHHIKIKKGMRFLRRTTYREEKLHEKIKKEIDKLKKYIYKGGLDHTRLGQLERLENKLLETNSYLIRWESKLSEDVKKEDSYDKKIEKEIDATVKKLNSFFKKHNKRIDEGKKRAKATGAKFRESSLPNRTENFTSDYRSIVQHLQRLIENESSFLNIIRDTPQTVRDMMDVFRNLQNLVDQARGIIKSLKEPEPRGRAPSRES